MSKETESNQYTGPQPRRSIRQREKLSANRNDESNDGDDIKSESSINSQNDSDQMNSSANESIKQTKKSSNKRSYADSYEGYAAAHYTAGRDYDRRSEPRRPESVNPETEYPSRESTSRLPAAGSDGDGNGFNWNMIVAIIFVTAAVALGGWFGHKSLLNKLHRIECPQLKALSEQYTHQEPRLWNSLKINIENVLNQTPKQPGVFLLAYNDRNTVKRVMFDIVNATAHCMNSHDPIQLNGQSFATAEMLKDYGEVIQAYREKLKSEGIMYVADLQDAPVETVQAFHTICDTITPLVHKSVIFFSLFIEHEPNKSDRSPSHINDLIETKLSNNWDSINGDTLNALVGRVTDQAFFLYSES